MLKRKWEEVYANENPKPEENDHMEVFSEKSEITTETDPLEIKECDLQIQEDSSPENEGSSSSRGTSSKRKNLKFEDCMKLITLECEWNECTDTFKKVETFCQHVDEHLSADSRAITEDGYLCIWRECGYFCDSKEELNRHVCFHAFHTKLKAIGSVLLKHNSGECVVDSSGRNMIPEIPEPFQCMWVECDERFASAQVFYWHVQSHILCVDPDDNKQYLCYWQGCSCTFKNPTRLSDHVRSHTQEKRVGCPNCGGIYSSNTKFFDHCARQIPLNLQQYKCSHCSTKFASERLLRDHVRRHVNHFKCGECEMTCTTKAVLLSHIRYRHSDYRPHKCIHCEKAFKVITDLNRHISVHSEDPPYLCPFLGCSYACRAMTTLNKHIKMDHDGMVKEPYACHMCNSKYSFGIFLTRHLISVHSFHWPPGHSRFRYKRDEDGFYRLQTVRYESIELTQEGDENLQEEVVDTPDPLPSPSPPSSSAVVSTPNNEPLSQRDANQDWHNSKMSSKSEKVLLKPPSSPQDSVTQEIILPSEYY
ncbi:histone H4 transcription factor-like [Macrobrachium rosenbergii]|uniref:histone H4 transcription factor-like n=1 Tax=Macrobrachium rosenbergii TaxID=79674 RepID=UPI0034D6F1B1